MIGGVGRAGLDNAEERAGGIEVQRGADDTGDRGGHGGGAGIEIERELLEIAAGLFGPERVAKAPGQSPPRVVGRAIGDNLLRGESQSIRGGEQGDVLVARAEQNLRVRARATQNKRIAKPAVVGDLSASKDRRNRPFSAAPPVRPAIETGGPAPVVRRSGWHMITPSSVIATMLPGTCRR